MNAPDYTGKIVILQSSFKEYGIARVEKQTAKTITVKDWNQYRKMWDGRPRIVHMGGGIIVLGDAGEVSDDAVGRASEKLQSYWADMRHQNNEAAARYHRRVKELQA